MPPDESDAEIVQPLPRELREFDLLDNFPVSFIPEPFYSLQISLTHIPQEMARVRFNPIEKSASEVFGKSHISGFQIFRHDRRSRQVGGSYVDKLGRDRVPAWMMVYYDIATRENEVGEELG